MSAINLCKLGKFGQTRPRGNLLSSASEVILSGWLAVSKTLETNEKILAQTIWCDPLDPHPNSPP